MFGGKDKKHFSALAEGGRTFFIANYIVNPGHKTAFCDNFHITDTANSNHELVINECFNILHKKTSLKENKDFELLLY